MQMKSQVTSCRGSARSRAVKAFSSPRSNVTVNARFVGDRADRREVLSLGAALVLASPLLGVPLPARADTVDKIKSLNPFERSAQRNEFQKMAEEALGEVVGAEDAALCTRLVFNDAATYDSVSKTGGLDGSIVLSDELERPENIMLKPVVEKLKVAKAKIDAAGEASGAGPISWADLMVLALKVTCQKQWAETKISRAETRSGGEIIVQNYSAAWPVLLGRVDSVVAAPTGRVPQPDAPVQDIKKFLLQLGADPSAKPGPFTPKPPFWERPGFLVWTQAAVDPSAEEARFAAAEQVYADMKRKYDISRGTITRTDYEVDFIDLYFRVTKLGCKFNSDAYLHA